MVMGRTVVRQEASAMEMVMCVKEMVEATEGKGVTGGMEVTGAKGVMAKGEMEATETIENKVMEVMVVAILLLLKKVVEPPLPPRVPHRIPLCLPARALVWILAIWPQLLKKPRTHRDRISLEMEVEECRMTAEWIRDIWHQVIQDLRTMARIMEQGLVIQELRIMEQEPPMKGTLLLFQL